MGCIGILGIGGNLTQCIYCLAFPESCSSGINGNQVIGVIIIIPGNSPVEGGIFFNSSLEVVGVLVLSQSVFKQNLTSTKDITAIKVFDTMTNSLMTVVAFFRIFHRSER